MIIAQSEIFQAIKREGFSILRSRSNRCRFRWLFAKNSRITVGSGWSVFS